LYLTLIGPNCLHHDWAILISHDTVVGPGVTETAGVTDCLKPFDARLMKRYPGSTRVNRPENDDPDCAQQVPIHEGPQKMF